MEVMNGGSMQDIELLLAYNSCFDAGKFDQLRDLLAPKFFFKNPLFEIRGRDQYIEYTRSNFITFTTNTLSIVEKEQGVYSQLYEISVVDSSQKTYDTIAITETNVIHDNQIHSAILAYDASCFSDETKNTLKKASVIHDEKSKL